MRFFLLDSLALKKQSQNKLKKILLKLDQHFIRRHFLVEHELPGFLFCILVFLECTFLTHMKHISSNEKVTACLMLQMDKSSFQIGTEMHFP